jgi:hypothetical protein
MVIYGAIASIYVVGIHYWDKLAGGKFSLEWLLGQFLAGSVIERVKNGGGRNGADQGDAGR